LKKCTLEDLVCYTETKVDIINKTLQYLEQSGFVQVNNGIIYFNNQKNKKRIETKSINTMFEYREEYEKEIIIKSFCLEIPPQKVAILLNLQKSCLCNYYLIFRRMIYERQYKILLNNYFDKPQIARHRLFYDKYAYFYVYNNQVFVTDKLLKGENEQKFSKSDVRRLSITYSFLRRVESHNVNEAYMYHRLAEYIWRKDKQYDELYKDLKENMLNMI